MFSNRESGWKRTEELNQGGPKTKAEVGQEVVDKYEKERKQREAGYKNHGSNYQQDNKQAKTHRGEQRGERRNETRNTFNHALLVHRLLSNKQLQVAFEMLLNRFPLLVEDL